MNIDSNSPARAVAPDRPAATEQRLLDAAGEVFAAHGFRAATVREICTRAKANIAAVNYHYGDKAGLYAAVFRYAHAASIPAPVDAAELARLRPAERLRVVIRQKLRCMLGQEGPAWFDRLLAREMVEPTGALEQMIASAIRPQWTQLLVIVRELVGDLPHAELRRHAASVIAQCAFYHHARPFIAQLEPDLRFDASEIDALAEQVTLFSLRGLAGVRARGASAAATSKPALRAERTQGQRRQPAPPPPPIKPPTAKRSKLSAAKPSAAKPLRQKARR